MRLGFPGQRALHRLAYGGCLVTVIVCQGCVVWRMVEGNVKLGVDVGRPFVIVKSGTASGWGMFSHPTVFTLPGGKVLVSYTAQGDIVGGGKYYSLTKDGGVSWTHGSALLNWAEIQADDTGVDTSARYSQGNTNLFIFHSGGFTIRKDGVAIGMTANSIIMQDGSPLVRGTLATSADGLTWEGPRPIVETIPGVDGKSVVVLSQHGVTLPGGDLLAAFYALAGPKNMSFAGMLRSSDGGTTWNFLSKLATPDDASWGNEGPGEPGIVSLPNGDLLCLMRTGSGGAGDPIKTSTSMLQARSKDGGKTWKLRKLGVNGVYPQLLLMSNGVLVCTFGRPGNSIMFSLDGGETWVRETALTAADLQTSGYADLVEVAPGRLLVVYDAFNTTLQKFWLWEPPDPINVIYGVFIDVKIR